MSIILGLSVNGAQTSACILKNGVITAAVAEERFTRIKRDNAFPNNAIAFCLEANGISHIDQCDAVAISWNPATNMRSINMSGFTRWRRYDPEWLYIVPNNLINDFNPDSISREALVLKLGASSDCPLYFVDHHMSHAAQCIAQSPFRSGAFAIVDEYGEVDSVTTGTFDRNTIAVNKRVSYPHSLGIFFAATTEHLGFVPNSDEWKVMGAAAYGDPARFSSPLGELLIWDDEEKAWYLNQRYIDFANMKKGGYGTPRLAKLLNVPNRPPGAPLEQVHFDLAAGAQAVFENLLFKLLACLAEETGESCLCASGGCFMNSLANGKIILNTPFESLFIPYSAADNGGSIGAAFWVHGQALDDSIVNEKNQLSMPFLGPTYAAQNISGMLHKIGIPYEYCEDPAIRAAEEIFHGRLVGWFSGAMEFGERALGARSILADPRQPDTKERINACVKYREPFRPFAASVLRDKASMYFDLLGSTDIPYMERVVRVRPEYASQIPAVTHHDGTCRIQTVDRQDHPEYHRLIQEFYRLSNVAMVLNTSFNLQGEPIVCSPEDAIRTFFTSGLEVLFMENCMITKVQRPEYPYHDTRIGF